METIIILLVAASLLILITSRLSRRKRVTEDKSLSRVFQLTWEYFAAHPSTREFTEVHTNGNGDFQIFAKGTEDCHEYEVTVVYPNNPDVYTETFKGTDSEKRVEEYILTRMNLRRDQQVSYQITAHGGPDVFFSFDE